MSWTAPSGHVYTTGEVVSAATLNTYVANDLTFLYGDTGWTAPTLAGTWVNFGAGGQAAGFRLIGTRVAFRGLIKNGTINTAAFTTPAGYRPPNDTCFFAVASLNAYGQVTVTAAGVVTPTNGSTTWVSLEGITFDTV